MATKITRDVLESYLHCKFKGHPNVATEQGVIAASAHHLVVAGTAQQFVIAGASRDQVIVGTAIDVIVAALGVDHARLFGLRQAAHDQIFVQPAYADLNSAATLRLGLMLAEMPRLAGLAADSHEGAGASATAALGS